MQSIVALLGTDAMVLTALAIQFYCQCLEPNAHTHEHTRQTKKKFVNYWLYFSV